MTAEEEEEDRKLNGEKKYCAVYRFQIWNSLAFICCVTCCSQQSIAYLALCLGPSSQITNV